MGPGPSRTLVRGGFDHGKEEPPNMPQSSSHQLPASAALGNPSACNQLLPLPISEAFEFPSANAGPPPHKTIICCLWLSIAVLFGGHWVELRS